MKFVQEDDLNDEELERLALEECKLLVNYFSKEEVDKLELELIDPEMAEMCIYGTMKGTCNSQEVYDFTQTLDVLIRVNFDPKDATYFERSMYYMTPLEQFIFKDSLEDDYIEADTDEDRMPNTALIIAEIKRLQSEAYN